jgi:hypothetical protein
MVLLSSSSTDCRSHNNHQENKTALPPAKHFKGVFCFVGQPIAQCFFYFLFFSFLFFLGGGWTWFAHDAKQMPSPRIETASRIHLPPFPTSLQSVVGAPEAKVPLAPNDSRRSEAGLESVDLLAGG